MAIYSIFSKMKGHIVSLLHITAATLNIENPSLRAADMLAAYAG